MSMRLRLAIMCLVVGLLPAIPLSLLVNALLEKSFNVGLSGTVSDALESGVSVSRLHLSELQARFERDAAGFVRSLKGTEDTAGSGSGSLPDSSFLAAAAARFGDIGFHRPGPDSAGGADTGAASALPRILSFLSGDPVFASLTGGGRVIPRNGDTDTLPACDTSGGATSLDFFDTEDRAAQIALWAGPGGENLILFRKTPPLFLSDAERILDGRRTFAQLHLSRTRLGRSFFYPFIFIYIAMVALSLGIAFFLAERLAAPIRRLERATTSVASGDWSVRLEERTGGETGRLEAGFNRMVARLDQQQRRLVDMEKMASWREMARHLAHEIKNPLLPIRLAVQEMRDQYRGGDAGYSNFLADSARLVEDELSSLQNLVKEFSSFARMPGLSIARGSLTGLVSDVARLYAGTEIRIDAESPPPESFFDQEAMRRDTAGKHPEDIRPLLHDEKGRDGPRPCRREEHRSSS